MIIIGLICIQNQLHSQNAWSYVGIPYTDWEYDPFSIKLEKPDDWPSTAVENYYYVAPNHPNASDAIQSGELTGTYGRYGYPDRPRKTIPSNSWIGDVYTPGTIIWLKGGNYNATNFHRVWSPQFQGNNNNPIWIHGDPEEKPVFSNVILGMYNSQHTIVENINWIGGNTTNAALTLTRDREGPTHHITLRNLLFENLKYIGGGGAIVGLTSNSASNAELHNVVAYKNTFKNCGGGYDWATRDNDHHAYKVNGNINGNQVYKVWIIENKALVGENPDPIDGLYKSLSGNLVQVGDQIASSGGNHHIFVAGNYQEFSRQALGWTKRATDVIFSTNYCTDSYTLAGGNGQCYGHQYGLGDYNWWINNVGTKSGVGWQHTANDPMKGPLFIIGNLFYNNRDNESNNNWRLCSGVTLFSQHGEHYIVNNIFDSSCHGIWSGTNRHGSNDKTHIYNNIFTNISATIDQTSRAITFDTTNGLSLYIGNNLFDTYNASVSISRTSYNTIENLNTQAWAIDNKVGDPLYEAIDQGNFTTLEDSPTINAGTQTYQAGHTDVYQQYIDRYKDDPFYPGNPVDYWPKDYLGRNRVINGTIDIGPYEFGADPVTTPPNPNPNPDPETDPSNPEEELDNTISLVPNPTDDRITINMGQNILREIVIYDALGKRLKTMVETTTSIANLSAGLYFVKIVSVDKKVKIKKLIKR